MLLICCRKNDFDLIGSLWFLLFLRQSVSNLHLCYDLAGEQALELGVWVFVGGRGWGEGKE